MEQFGIEIEFVSPLEGKELVKHLSNIVYIDDEKDIHIVHAFWKVVPDYSIASKSGEYALELVSPILHSLVELPDILKTLNELKCKVNKTCGLHVHIDIKDFGVTEIYDLIMRVMDMEGSIYKLCPTHRRLGNPGNKYCRPIGIHYHPYFQKPLTSTEEERTMLLKSAFSIGAHKVWAPREDKVNRKVAGSSVPLRSLYAGLNFLRLWDFGTVEFRYAGSTLEFDIIKKWVNLYIGIMDNKNMEDNHKALEASLDIEEEDTYKPLPDGLTIQESGIEGLGLFCKDAFDVNYVFGISHVSFNGPKKNFKQQVIRTPLGGFINHSEEPNCKVIKHSRDLYCLIAIRDLKAGEELTVYYHMYGIE